MQQPSQTLAVLQHEEEVEVRNEIPREDIDHPIRTTECKNVKIKNDQS